MGPDSVRRADTCAVGNWLGFRHYIAEEATHRHPNLFLALAGGTGSGKGTSYRWTDWVMRALDAQWSDERVTTAVGSGEGLLAKITDPVVTLNAKGEEVVAIEGSPRQTCAVPRGRVGLSVQQDGLSREPGEDDYEGLGFRRLETTTKKEAMTCNEPHVSIIGHITPDELTSRCVDARLIDNGFSNRWLYCVIKPTQVKFDSITPEQIDGLTAVRDELVGQLQRFSLTGADEFVFTPDAHDAYMQTARYLYDNPHTGAMEKQDARSRPLMFKLSIIYAAMDGSNKVELHHFLAARSFWAYCSRSARSFFGQKSGNENVDRFMEMWRFQGYEPLTITEISDMFQRNMKRRQTQSDAECSAA